jgi:hypothetical protein
VECGSSHPPFPETGGKSDQFELVAGMLNPAIGKVSMGATVERLKKKEFHENTLAHFIIALLGMIRYTSATIKSRVSGVRCQVSGKRKIEAGT